MHSYVLSMDKWIFFLQLPCLVHTKSEDLTDSSVEKERHNATNSSHASILVNPKQNFTNPSNSLVRKREGGLSERNYKPKCKSSCVVSCPVGWEREKDHCYLLNREAKNWFDAEETCRMKGGHLASVSTKHINQHFKAKKWKDVWIGGVDVNKKNNWTWSDCSSWDFEEWSDNEPNGNNEHCVEVIGNNRWNDRNCRDRQNFVCSMKTCSGKSFPMF